jgi:galactokinase
VPTEQDSQVPVPQISPLLMVGAGWGGAIVALTTKGESGKVVEGLVREYYNVKFPEIGEEELRKMVFATQPGSGASVYIVDKNGIK